MFLGYLPIWGPKLAFIGEVPLEDGVGLLFLKMFDLFLSLTSFILLSLILFFEPELRSLAANFSASMTQIAYCSWSVFFLEVI